jgi:hypothetical protein
MSGQNKKITNGNKRPSSSTSAYSPPFFTWKPTTSITEKEIRCNPKPHEVGKTAKEYKGEK